MGGGIKVVGPRDTDVSISFYLGLRDKRNFIILSCTQGVRCEGPGSSGEENFGPFSHAALT